MALYAVDGSLNITVVSGTTYVGRYAPDGSLNVIAAPGSLYVGQEHPSGAMYVTVVSSGGPYGRYAPDGSTQISVSPYLPSTVKATVVSGSFGPPASGFLPWGLLGTYLG